MRALGFLMLLTLAAACGGEDAPPSIAGEASDCGGFVDAQGERPYPDDYCAAERLVWRVDRAQGTLEIADTRVLLNCCGVRKAALERTADTYVLRETDSPESAGRCDCTCIFDYRVRVDEIPDAPVTLSVVREITDATSAPSLIFETTIDPAQEEGLEVVDTTEAYQCEP